MSTFIEGVALYAVGGDIPGMGAPEERRYRSLEGADPNLVRAFLDAQTASAVYALTGTIVPNVHKEANISPKRYLSCHSNIFIDWNSCNRGNY